jgi:MoaA/NifB/PqqE/SkfB family radical SAM enzyme
MNDLGWPFLSAADKEAILLGVESGGCCGGPYHVELHPTDRCTTRCFFCSTRWRREKAELSLEAVRALGREMQEAGTRSVLLSGGGEPLAHRQTEAMLEALASTGIPLAGVTTNGVGLTGPVRALLRETQCGQVIVSLNCADEPEYIEMMKVGPRVFHRVLGHARALVEERARGGAPKLILQYLVYKKNFRTIPAMYARALELGADGIMFNGLAYLPAELRMTREETRTMLGLFEEVLRADEYRRILGIHSFEQDFAEGIQAIERRIGHERAARGAVRRAAGFLLRRGQTLVEKLEHRRKMRRRAAVQAFLGTRRDPCIRPWYGVTVRSDGTVPVCCVRQHVPMGSVHRQTLGEIWRGEAFTRYREQMRKLILAGDGYRNDPADDLLSAACQFTSTGIRRCPFRSFYYREDLEFLARLEKLVGPTQGNMQQAGGERESE